MLLTKPMLFFVQALLLVSANASSTGGTRSEPNIGDSVDGFDYQRCPSRPEETVPRRIISPHLLFPSSVTTRDLLIKEGLKQFFGSGHGETAGMLLTKPMLFFVQCPWHASSENDEDMPEIEAAVKEEGHEAKCSKQKLNNGEAHPTCVSIAAGSNTKIDKKNDTEDSASNETENASQEAKEA
ncbi:hypothetical protein HPB50_022005 [Hyalomma asiaticum]|uniref:Uncharacterized protein n=1 Tax=Hyalomma asiaticum TaxID=266040 RepID=A0ACB7SY50_HYAAI|nr:hypothetical protein HPB50_022005 [Hyalomma asiaticum]